MHGAVAWQPGGLSPQLQRRLLPAPVRADQPGLGSGAIVARGIGTQGHRRHARRGLSTRQPQRRRSAARWSKATVWLAEPDARADGELRPRRRLKRLAAIFNATTCQARPRPTSPAPKWLYAILTGRIHPLHRRRAHHRRRAIRSACRLAVARREGRMREFNFFAARFVAPDADLSPSAPACATLWPAPFYPTKQTLHDGDAKQRSTGVSGVGNCSSRALTRHAPQFRAVLRARARLQHRIGTTRAERRVAAWQPSDDQRIGASAG